MGKHLAYKNKLGVTYYLYSKLVHLRGGKPVRIYFFNKDNDLKSIIHSDNPAQPEDALPLGYGIRETKGRNIPLPYRKSDGQMIGGRV